MEAMPMKEELYHFIEEGDTRLIKMLYALAKEYVSEANELSEDQLDELDTRIEKYDAGQMKFSSWDAVKDRIRSRAKKNAL
jgi:putative addiction module component (TIGR02574 family)